MLPPSDGRVFAVMSYLGADQSSGEPLYRRRHICFMPQLSSHEDVSLARTDQSIINNYMVATRSRIINCGQRATVLLASAASSALEGMAHVGRVPAAPLIFPLVLKITCAATPIGSATHLFVSQRGGDNGYQGSLLATQGPPSQVWESSSLELTGALCNPHLGLLIQPPQVRSGRALRVNR